MKKTVIKGKRKDVVVDELPVGVWFVLGIVIVHLSVLAVALSASGAELEQILRCAGL